MTREEIIFSNTEDQLDFGGGVERFSEITLEQLELLNKEGHLDLEDNQNGSPTTGEFLQFMRKYPEVTAHGYVVSTKRSDSRVTLEGIACTDTDISFELMKDFTTLCRHADEFDCESNNLYAWWD